METQKAGLIIYSYAKVWKIEKKIYAIQNFILPVPVDPWQLLYFGGTWFFCSIFFSILPGFLKIPVIIRSIIIPLGISRFLMTKKLDGKNPIRFFLGIMVFLFTEQGKVIERFTSNTQKQNTIRLNWKCSQGRE